MGKKWGIITIGMGLILLIGILAASVEELVLCPGYPIVIDRPPVRGGVATVIPIDMQWLIWVLYMVMIVWAIIAVLAFIFIPQARKRILIALAVIAVLTIGCSLLLDKLRVEEQLVEEEIPVCEEAPPLPLAHLDLPPSGAVEEEPPPLPDVPGWAIYPAAGALGIAVAFLLLRRRRGKLRQQTWEEEIAQVALETSEELRGGLPIANVVMRCWMRMVEILSLRAGVRDAPSLTPREFTGLLRGRGFPQGAIDCLTHLFEEVRYGRMLPEPRRGEALAALANIEEAVQKL
jgi:hypothetical protein